MTLVVLIGPPGAGKSTVGRALAQRLGADFTDTDDLVVQRSGSSISDLFVDHGEAHFRDLEAQAVADALAEPSGVVALGGGAAMTPATADLLGRLGPGSTVVFLDVAIADAGRRVGFDQSRPLLAVNPRATWVRLMNERRPTYERLADLQVDTGGRTPTEVVDDIVARLDAAGERA